MTVCVGIFSSESWSKCITIRHTTSISLNVQLTTNTEKNRFSKHVLLIIDFLLFKWNISEVIMIIIIDFSFLFFFFLLLFVLFSLLCRIITISCFFFGFLFIFNWYEFSSSNWLALFRKNCCHLEHFTSTFAV